VFKTVAFVRSAILPALHPRRSGSRATNQPTCRASRTVADSPRRPPSTRPAGEAVPTVQRCARGVRIHHWCHRRAGSTTACFQQRRSGTRVWSGDQMEHAKLPGPRPTAEQSVVALGDLDGDRPTTRQ
jgi:hypothetical protein